MVHQIQIMGFAPKDPVLLQIHWEITHSWFQTSPNLCPKCQVTGTRCFPAQTSCMIEKALGNVSFLRLLLQLVGKMFHMKQKSYWFAWKSVRDGEKTWKQRQPWFANEWNVLNCSFYKNLPNCKHLHLTQGKTSATSPYLVCTFVLKLEILGDSTNANPSSSKGTDFTESHSTTRCRPPRERSRTRRVPDNTIVIEYLGNWKKTDLLCDLVVSNTTICCFVIFIIFKMLMNMLKIIENVSQGKWTMKVLAETHHGVFLVLISEMWPFLLQIWFDKNDHEASSGTGIKRFADPKYMILKSSPYVNCCFRTSYWKISRLRWMKNMPFWLPTCFPSWPPKATYVPNGTRHSYVDTSWLKLKHARWTAGRTEASQNWSLPHVGFGNARNIELRMKGLF